MGTVELRPATLEDVRWFSLWDHDADVIACSSDDPDAEIAFADTDWAEELAAQSELSRYYIGELDGRPIGAMQICDPHLEPTHYWGEIAPNLRAVDIWIGDAADRGRGHGREMMRRAHEICFADARVTAVVIDPLASNERALRFYRRLGYRALGPRMFGDDRCIVHELTRAGWEAAAGNASARERRNRERPNRAAPEPPASLIIVIGKGAFRGPSGARLH